MAVVYESKLTPDMILNDVIAFSEWRGEFILRVIFMNMTQSFPPPPTSFLDWCKREGVATGLSQATIDELARLHARIVESARAVAEAVTTGDKKPVIKYGEFARANLDYIQQLKKIESETHMIAGAIDPLTHLRSTSGMIIDLRRELERKNRKGMPFCICAVEVDNFKPMQDGYLRTDMDKVVVTVANTMAKTVRSFDDAYYLGFGRFLLVLKQIEILDASSVMDRMRSEIEYTKIDLSSGDRINVTASFGVADPVDDGKTPDEINANAFAALASAQKLGGNRVEQFREMSRLAQMARNMKGEG